MKLKKLTALLLGVTMTVTMLSGCGGAAKTDDSSTSSTTETTTESSDTAGDSTTEEAENFLFRRRNFRFHHVHYHAGF